MFDFVEQPNFPARYNVAPTQPVPVVILEQGARHFRLMRWGFMPSWVKEPKTFALLINARSETVQDKPAFKNAIKRRRCLLPADGYYEWQTRNGRKRPFFIAPKDGGPIGFAGLVETWSGPNGEEVDTVAIVTAAARREMTSLHHRVPVTITPENFGRWLNCNEVDAVEAATLLVAPSVGDFVWYPVSNAVNHVAHDDPSLVQPISEADAAKEDAQGIKQRKTAASRRDDGGQGSLF